MCTFNDEKYIRSAIESVLNQTFGNFELLIWNDGSTDNTEKIVNSYNDPRIRYFYNENTGQGMAARLACIETKGEYIARIDSDDIALPNRFEEQVKYLQSHPEVVLVSCAPIYIDEKGKDLGYGIPYTWERSSRYHMKEIIQSGVMMRKSAYLKSGGYQPLKRNEDLFLWYRLIKFGRFHIIQYPLIKYRVRQNSLSHTLSDFFRHNTRTLWRFFAEKPNFDQKDIDYMNRLIEQNIEHRNIPNNPVNRSENILLRCLMTLLPLRTAFQVVFLIKNSYGLIKNL